MIRTGIPITALEKAINWALALDPELVDGLTDFADKRIAVDVEDIDLQVCLRPGPRGVALEPWRAGSAPPADVSVGGSALTLMSLLYRGRTEVDAPPLDEVQVAGDVALLQQLLALLGRAQLDWEEWIARVAGDVAGHQLARGLRGLVEWSAAARRRFEVNVAEYLRQEAHLLPEREELAAFASDVDCLRDDVERLEQRLRRLGRGDGPRPARTQS